ncbi:hypothetical protein LguiA_017706 [Lonicera macranthoides]
MGEQALNCAQEKEVGDSTGGCVAHKGEPTLGILPFNWTMCPWLDEFPRQAEQVPCATTSHMGYLRMTYLENQIPEPPPHLEETWTRALDPSGLAGFSVLGLVRPRGETEALYWRYDTDCYVVDVYISRFLGKRERKGRIFLALLVGQIRAQSGPIAKFLSFGSALAERCLRANQRRSSFFNFIHYHLQISNAQSIGCVWTEVHLRTNWTEELEKGLRNGWFIWRVLVRYCDGSSFTGDVEQVNVTVSHDPVYYRGERVFDAVVEDILEEGMYCASNGSEKNLPKSCTSVTQPGALVSYILSLANIPVGRSWVGCQFEVSNCSEHQKQTLQGFRVQVLSAVLSGLTNRSSRGFFLNTCHTHCQSLHNDEWIGKRGSKLHNKPAGRENMQEHKANFLAKES